jgi:hypothetical protein
MTLMTVPLFSTVLPPLFDYPNHLARLYLLMEGGNAFYAVRWEPLPNLAQDLIVPPLAGLMPLDLAAKLFLVMVFGLIAGGAIWLNRVATGAWRFWPLLAFLLLYNRIFLWGFVNYLFGIGVAGWHGIVARSRTEAIMGQGARLVDCGAPLLFQSHCCSWVLCAGDLGG